MSQVALIGDCTTTTALALAAAWQRAEDVLVVELDPRGGSLAGWMDVPLTPSLSTLVAAVHSGQDHPAEDLASLVRQTESGVRFIPAPYRSREAARAVVEARRTLLPRLGDLADVVLWDTGTPLPGIPSTDVVGGADVVIVGHRQDTSSPGAAMVRLERLRELIDAVSGVCAEVIVALVGSDPFDGAQIAAHIDPNVTWIELADDPLAAACHAGRRGVSPRRMARLPLSRRSRHLADAVHGRLPARPLDAEHA